MSLAKQLRRAVRDSGQSITAVARGAGITQPMLRKFVVERRDLRLRTASKLARYFNLELRGRDA